MGLVLLTAVLVATSRAQSAAHPPFMIGLLFDNGDLQPLMRFASGAWTTPWPTQGGVPVQPPTIELPSSIATIPRAWWPGFSGATWYAVLASGVRPLKLVTVTSVHAGCGDLAPAIRTDYDGPRRLDDPMTVRSIGPAFAGDVTIRRIETRHVDSPPDATWREGERRLLAAVRRHGRPVEGLRLQFVARISREAGGAIWSMWSVDSGRSVSSWQSEGGESLELVVDRETEVGHEMAGAITPIASIDGIAPLTLFAWEQGFDGGEYVLVTVSSQGLGKLAAAGGGSC